MRYEVRHYETAHVGLGYDVLACFERDGLVKSMAYVPNCYPAHIVVEAINDKMVIAYMVDSNGDMHSLTLVHVLEIEDKYTVLRKLQQQLKEDFERFSWYDFSLVCNMGDMVAFIEDIVR